MSDRNHEINWFSYIIGGKKLDRREIILKCMYVFCRVRIIDMIKDVIEYEYIDRNKWRGDRLVDAVAESVRLGADKTLLEEGLRGACEGDHTDIIDMMIACGATNLNKQLQEACARGHTSIIEALIIRGANVFDSVAMYEAGYFGRLDSIDLLLKFGATDLRSALRGAQEGSGPNSGVHIHNHQDVINVITARIEAESYLDSYVFVDTDH